ncbi:MAG: YdiU family protein [Pseudomonadota bacterium]|nr:YdiU family protein [Pseudomonadota bacterium]
MPTSTSYAPDPRYSALGEGFADPVPAARFPKRILRFRNDRHAARVGLDTLTDPEWEAAFARFEPLPGNLAGPLALRYHGHQFHSYNPQLGDGRGFLYAQLRDDRGRLLDLGTKGSGTTPWSRGGDGRLTLKGGVREILATEMLEALGVDTSKTFSLYETGEDLWRGDEPSPTRSSVMVRLSHSHLRFGTFQRLAAYRDRARMERLLAYAIEQYHPQLLQGGVAGPAAFLSAVCSKVAFTCGRWMSAGFVHGVLNTDNMNITGESFDYGPWRFLPEADPRFTAAYFDSGGLYAYGRQPVAVRWNLDQLAFALSTLGEPLDGALDGFGAALFEGMSTGLLRRLGLASAGEAADTALVQAWFGFAEQSRAPFDRLFFDWYGGVSGSARAARSPSAGLYAGEGFAPVLDVLSAFVPVAPERLADPYWARERPVDLRIETVEALWDAIAYKDDWAPLHAHVAGIRELGALLSKA